MARFGKKSGDHTDSRGRPDGFSKDRGQGTNDHYDSRGKPVGFSKDRGAGTTEHFNARGRPTGFSRERGANSTEHYDAHGDPAGFSKDRGDGTTDHFETRGNPAGSTRSGGGSYSRGSPGRARGGSYARQGSTSTAGGVSSSGHGGGAGGGTAIVGGCLALGCIGPLAAVFFFLIIIQVLESRAVRVADLQQHPRTVDLFALIGQCRDNRTVCSPERLALFLREGADPNGIDETGQSVLEQALNNRLTTEAVATLLDMGADPSKPGVLNRGHWGDPEVLRLLLESGADPNLADRHGFTPLMSAVHQYTLEHQLSGIALLLAAGADSRQRSPDGRCAIDLAKEKIARSRQFLETEYGDLLSAPDYTLEALRDREIILKTLVEGDVALLRRQIAKREAEADRRAAAERGLSSEPLERAPRCVERPSAVSVALEPLIVTNVCPYEGCNFGRRVAVKEVRLYAHEGVDVQNGPIIQENAGYVITTGNLWIRQPGRVRVQRDVDMVILWDYQRVRKSAGEAVVILSRLGEGQVLIQDDSGTKLIHDFWWDGSGVVEVYPYVEWWYKVRTEEGAIGWGRFEVYQGVHWCDGGAGGGY